MARLRECTWTFSQGLWPQDPRPAGRSEDDAVALLRDWRPATAGPPRVPHTVAMADQRSSPLKMPDRRVEFVQNQTVAAALVNLAETEAPLQGGSQRSHAGLTSSATQSFAASPCREHHRASREIRRVAR